MPMSFFALGEYNLIKLNQHDPGFTAMSSGVRVPSEFAIFNRLEIILDNVFAETHAALHFKATRTSDRAGRARAPTHAHPVFDNKVLTPTRPARAKKINGRPPAHWARV